MLWINLDYKATQNVMVNAHYQGHPQIWHQSQPAWTQKDLLSYCNKDIFKFNDSPFWQPARMTRIPAVTLTSQQHKKSFTQFPPPQSRQGHTMIIIINIHGACARTHFLSLFVTYWLFMLSQILTVAHNISRRKKWHWSYFVQMIKNDPALTSVVSCTSLAR